jgi:hypothetical protein
MALALPVLAPLLFAVPWIQSVTLSPADVSSGSSSTATVTLEAPSLADVAVDLYSSNPVLASVPTKGIVVPAGSRTASFAVATKPGTIGCATISATVSNTAAPQSALLFIKPSPSLLDGPPSGTLSLAPSVTAGDTLVGHVHGAVPGILVQLTSSNPSVTVPASVVLATPTLVAPGGLGEVPIQGAGGGAAFTIRTTRVKATTCTVITAIIGGSQRRALLKVIKPLY